MRRSMKFLLTSLIFGLSELGGAHALATEFHVGTEEQLYRGGVVSPNFFPILKMGFQGSSPHTEFDLELKFSAQHPKANALVSKNLFYRFQEAESSFQIAVGRKWINWSEGDELWNTGIINPLDAWDRFRPKSQGLTGIFMSAENDSIRFDLFGSYLMIPEVMPNVVIENNQFQFFHPQSVSSGPQTFELLGKQTNIGYNVALPSLNKLLIRPSILSSIESKNSISPIHVRLTAGYLPLNYFPVALQAGLIINNANIIVDLNPRILAHAVYSGDLSVKVTDEIKIGFTAIRDEIFQENSIPADYTTATLGATNYFTPWLKLGDLKASYLYSTGGLGPDEGPNANPNQNLFSSRILYRNAAQISYEIGEFNAQILHEFSINADWIAMDWKKQWNQNWSTVLGGDLISAEKLSASDRGAEFLADLRAVDRIRLGVNYVF